LNISSTRFSPNPKKDVENTENFIYVIFIVTIFTKLLNAQRR